ncbi:hypothetical protein DBV05_g11635 [Lasiodiplodia theobromae]|uniref:Uncharacterized protein n=1 Tax=Lasiodiplodia theobromae TaxID=45133 RepID=A0A5N5CWN0_9PEZI|nr:hypothetical protein DBV05_g11635 [Lasiodiplodia theobromae]
MDQRLAAIAEQEIRPSPPPCAMVSKPTSAYEGSLRFGRERMDAQLVPAIFVMLQGFPDAKQTSCSKVRTGEGVMRGVDASKISGLAMIANSAEGNHQFAEELLRRSGLACGPSVRSAHLQQQQACDAVYA